MALHLWMYGENKDIAKWDFRFSQWRVLTWLSSGMMCHIVHQQGDDDEGSKILWIVGKLLPDYMQQHPRRQSVTFKYIRSFHSVLCLGSCLSSAFYMTITVFHCFMFIFSYFAMYMLEKRQSQELHVNIIDVFQHQWLVVVRRNFRKSLLYNKCGRKLFREKQTKDQDPDLFHCAYYQSLLQMSYKCINVISLSFWNAAYCFRCGSKTC
jgi:hypothetical protein